MRFIILLAFLLVSLAAAAGPGTRDGGEVACFKVSGMTCPSCRMTVKAAVRQIDGIKDVTVSVKDSEAFVSFNPKKTSAKDIGAAITTIGGDYKASIRQCEG